MSIDLEVTDGVAWITMNRPERKNAFTREQYDALGATLDRVDGDDTVRVAVLTGAGAAFSSGQDLKEMAEMATAVAEVDRPVAPVDSRCCSTHSNVSRSP